MNTAQAKAFYETAGYFLAPPLVDQDLISRAVPRMDAVVEGHYATGDAPMPQWKPGDDSSKLRKIDQAHIADPVLFELVSQSAIGAWAAALTGAEMVQVWAIQMLFKPPSTAATGALGNVGWHQDWQYWHPWWQPESELFTAWLAVSDVREESGPMRFVPESQRWGFLDQGNFFDGDLRREDIAVPPGQIWREDAAILPPGGVSFHHRLTYHGSGPNTSHSPRRSFAIHLRTEKSAPVLGCDEYYVSHLDNPAICPVIYRRS